MARVKKAPQPKEVQATIKELVRRTLREALEAELEEFLGMGDTSARIPTIPGTATVPRRLRPLPGPWRSRFPEIGRENLSLK